MPLEEAPHPSALARWRSARQAFASAHPRWRAFLSGCWLAVCILGLALLITGFVVKPYVIPSGSMEPTLAIGQRVLVDRLGERLFGPSVGQIVVFHPPQGADSASPPCGSMPGYGPVSTGGASCSAPYPKEDTGTNFIKRIVAGPGDEIYVQGGLAYVKAPGAKSFRREAAPYAAPCGTSSECDFTTPVTVPPGHWFMMGDNRGDSDDSRFWGPVPTSWIVGPAVATYWPLHRIGTL
jgi:signal peptidase I